MEGDSFLNEYLRKLLFLPPQASNFSKGVDHLHFFVIITTMVAATGIFLAALVFLILFKRRSPGERGKAVGSGPLLEVLFIGTPLSFFLLWFGMGIRQYVAMVSPPEGAMEVYVLAKQWMWKFNYADGPIAQATLHVPVGRPVKLLLTSRDVIHSFFVPAFRLKRDVLPGRYTELWFQATEPGTYEILCAEYCGANHSYMRGSVIAMPADEFDRWFAQQKKGPAVAEDASAPGTIGAPVPNDMAKQGERVVAEQGCLKCHSVDGSPHIGPTWLGLYHRHEQLTDGQTIVVDEPYITESMMDPAGKIVAGYRPLMPSYQGKLSPAETAAILEYIKSLRSLPLQAQPSARPVYELRP